MFHLFILLNILNILKMYCIRYFFNKQTLEKEVQALKEAFAQFQQNEGE